MDLLAIILIIFVINQFFNQYIRLIFITDRVKLENQRLWEERRCKICGDGETAVLFDPCGHMCACVDCSAVQRHCPLCGQFIGHHHRVFRA